MRRILIAGVVLIAVAIALWAQGTQQVPIWNGSRYTFPRLGPTLSVVNGELNAVQPQAKVRKYNQLLTFDTNLGGWQLPPGSSNVVVHCNGLRYREGVDYSTNTSNSLIIPAGTNMTAADVVTADFDQ